METREDARAMTWIPSEYYILVVSDFALAVVVCKFALCLSPELGSFEATAATFSQVDEEHLLQWRLSRRVASKRFVSTSMEENIVILNLSQ